MANFGRVIGLLCAVAVVLTVVSVLGGTLDQGSRVSKAKREAERICAPAAAWAEDAQGETHINYQCGGSGPVRTIEYGVDYWIYW